MDATKNPCQNLMISITYMHGTPTYSHTDSERECLRLKRDYILPLSKFKTVLSKNEHFKQ